MKSDSAAATDDQSEVLFQWSARKLQPIVLLYVAAIFVAMMLFSYFVVHSMAAVKALAMTAVVSMLPLVPAILSRVEYRITGQRLDRRPVSKEKPREFETVFELDQLSYIVPMRHGFKFYRPLNEPNPARRFWKLHISDEYSGEVHVETADRERVFELLRQHGVSSR